MSTNSEQLEDFGVLAEFENVTDIVRTCEKVRDGGYTRWDSYSPFPIHGIDPAMGIKPTKMPILIFCMGVTGTFTGLCLQYYMNAYDYQYMLSGKPIFSLPANVPVMFELTILFAALTTFFGTLIVNGLPRFYNPLLRLKNSLGPPMTVTSFASKQRIHATMPKDLNSSSWITRQYRFKSSRMIRKSIQPSRTSLRICSRGIRRRVHTVSNHRLRASGSERNAEDSPEPQHGLSRKVQDADREHHLQRWPLHALRGRGYNSLGRAEAG